MTKVGHIYLVDDDESMRTSLGRMLKDVGYIVEEFSSAVAFLEHSVTVAPAVILLDMRMPEMDGITAAQRIRSMTYESFCNVPLVAFTAGVTDEERQKAKDAGMHYFMPKPFTKDDLINLIAELGLISL